MDRNDTNCAQGRRALVNKKNLQLLRKALAVLEEPIALLQECNEKETEMLLRMAQLNLRLQVHGIKEDEYREFCGMLEERYQEDLAKTSNKVDASPRLSRMQRYRK